MAIPTCIPGELTLIRTIGQGRWQHPFHEHANHVRILARDGNLILSPNTTPVTFGSGLSGDPGVQAAGLAGTLMFNTDTTPGESFDGIFYFTGRGLNWDPYGHHPAGTGNGVTQIPISAVSESGTTVTVSVNESQVPVVGGQIVVSGVTPAGYNGAFTVTGTSAGPSISITSIKETGSTVTATAAAALPAGFKIGAYVTVAGVPTAAYNGAFKILSVPTSTTFTYTATSTGLAAATSLTTASGSLNVANITYTAAAGLGTATVTGAMATVSLGSDSPSNDPLASLPCTPDVNGYNSGAPTAVNFMEWCQDHNKPVQVAPFGDVAAGGPRPCRIRTFSPTVPGTAARLTSVLTPPCADLISHATPPPAPTALTCCLPTRRPTRRTSVVGRSCGTRITSARSRPTTSSPAAC